MELREKSYVTMESKVLHIAMHSTFSPLHFLSLEHFYLLIFSALYFRVSPCIHVYPSLSHSYE